MNHSETWGGNGWWKIDVYSGFYRGFPSKTLIQLTVSHVTSRPIEGSYPKRLVRVTGRTDKCGTIYFISDFKRKKKKIYIYKNVLIGGKTSNVEYYY